MWCRKPCLPIANLSSRISQRQIHARPAQTFIAQRQRLESRTSEERLYPCASDFIPAPTQTPGPEESAETRRKIQWSKRPEEVLLHLNRAIKANHFDSAVVGSAMKRCEQGRWWDCLCQVRLLQTRHQVEMTDVTLGIYLTGLARCASGEAYGVRKDRREKLLQLGQDAWDTFGSFSGLNQTQVGILLNSALHLCSIAASAAALEWAEQLWHLASLSGGETLEGTWRFEATRVNYETFLTILSKCGQQQRVDDMLDSLEEKGWRASPVLVAALVHVAGEQRNSERAEELWRRLVDRVGAKPNLMAIAARAKAQMLVGKIPACADIIEQGIEQGGMTINYKVFEMLVQALTLIYHSSLSLEDRLRLQKVLESHAVDIRDMSTRQQQDWVKLRGVADALLAEPKQLRHRDLLVTWHAQRAMVKWANFQAGTAYLSMGDSSRS